MPEIVRLDPSLQGRPTHDGLGLIKKISYPANSGITKTAGDKFLQESYLELLELIVVAPTGTAGASEVHLPEWLGTPDILFVWAEVDSAKAELASLILDWEALLLSLLYLDQGQLGSAAKLVSGSKFRAGERIRRFGARLKSNLLLEPDIIDACRPLSLLRNPPTSDIGRSAARLRSALEDGDLESRQRAILGSLDIGVDDVSLVGIPYTSRLEAEASKALQKLLAVALPDFATTKKLQLAYHSQPVRPWELPNADRIIEDLANALNASKEAITSALVKADLLEAPLDPDTPPRKAPEYWRDRKLRENPEQFIKRVYAFWLGRSLTRGHIRNLDFPLYQALARHVSRHTLKIDLPDREELLDRKLKEVGLPMSRLSRLSTAALDDAESINRIKSLRSAAQRRIQKRKHKAPRQG